MTNLRGVGGAPRGLRTHQPSLHGRRTNEFRRAIKTAPTRRASSQRSNARKDSANVTNVPPTNERQSTTNEKSLHPQPTHLQSNPNQQILKAMIRGITPSHGQARPIAALVRPIEACSIIRATGKRYGRITPQIRGGQRVPTARFQRVEIIGRTGERAEIWGFSEVST